MAFGDNSHALALLAAWLCAAIACGQGRLLLKSGFESNVRVTEGMRDIAGIDEQSGFDWTATPAWIDSSRFVYLVSKGKTPSDYMTSSIETAIGPFGNETRVLRLANKADDPDHGSTSRNEYSFFVKPVPHDFRQGYVRYWMKLQGNLGQLHPRDKATPWYMVMEWKEPNSGISKSAEECGKRGQRPGGSNNYRINVHIQRQAGAKEFRWYLTGEHPQPCRKTEWRYLNPDVEVPLGRWFRVVRVHEETPHNGARLLRGRRSRGPRHESHEADGLHRAHRTRRQSVALAILVPDEELPQHGLESRRPDQPMV
jgi:hypothetical protein